MLPGLYGMESPTSHMSAAKSRVARLIWRSFRRNSLLGSLALVLAVYACPLAAQSGTASSAGEQKFSVSGTVVNSATGEPVGRALVRILGPQPQSCFTDGDGHFQMDGLFAGRFPVFAQKPGFLGNQSRPQMMTIGANSDSVVLQLIPQSAISGRVLDVNEQPIEHMQLRLIYLDMRDGHKRLESRGYAETGDDGRYRFANLEPGTYYLAAGPGEDHTRLLAADERPKSGYPLVFYPGVPDRSSAAPLQLSGGQQMHADFAMALQPNYQVSGTVSGLQSAQGVAVQFFDTSGDDLAIPVKFNAATGRFTAESVTAGSYVVKAFAQLPNQQSLHAEAHVTVGANSESLHLALEPVSSIPVQVRMESHNSTQQPANAGPPPVSVRLLPEDVASPEAYGSLLQPRPGQFQFVVQNVEPGRYEAVISPHGGWYVASATYGQANVLTELLNVLPGGAVSPLDIVLRDDAATLSGNVKSFSNVPLSATIIALADGARTPYIAQAPSGDFTLSGLPPGDYLVFAFDKIAGLEYGNLDALEPYSSHAAKVTLAPNQKTQITLDLISTGER